MNLFNSIEQRIPDLSKATALSRGWAAPILLILALVFSLYKLGSSEVQSWDEALYGNYAREMMDTGDPVNYYYGSELEFWNGKPPLSVWAIAGSYSVWGFNEFALRFPSAMASVAFFMLMFAFISRYKSPLFALFSCLILMGGHGIVGEHVGRTGDTDMLFSLWMLGFSWAFFAYFQSQRLKDALWAGLFLALAFYTKSIAAVFLAPGILLFLLFQKQLLPFLRKKESWAALLLFLALAASWILILLIWGKDFGPNPIGSKNALETMFVYDGVKRFSDPSFVNVNPWKLDFVWVVLDTKLNLWNYLFIGLFLAGTAVLVRRFKEVVTWLRLPSSRLFCYALCMFIACSLFFTFSRNKNGWYFSPVLPFVSILLVEGLSLLPKQKLLRWGLAALTLFLLARRFTELGWEGPGYREFFAQHSSKLQEVDRVYYHTPEAEPSAILYLSWLNEDTRDSKSGEPKQANIAWFGNAANLPPGIPWREAGQISGKVLAFY